jgi:DNA (cytosine-5)-methyltransferase 1
MKQFSESNTSFTFIDLFAGAGGLAEGFLSSGFFPIAHVEKDPDACNTIRTRLCYYHLLSNNRIDFYHKYLKKEISREEFYNSASKLMFSSVINETISEHNIESIFLTIDGLLSKNHKASIDVIVGGPPCQAYSLVGRAVSKDGMEKDPRNHLYKLYLQFIKKYKPKIFLFENVPGMISAKEGKYWNDLQKKAKDAGYKLQSNIVSANKYDVLQKRIRAIIIGIRKDLETTPFDFPIGADHSFTLRDIFCDLPKPTKDITAKQKFNYIAQPSKYCLDKKIRDESDILTWHVTRKINDHDKKIYKIAIRLWESKRERLSYIDIPVNLKTHKNEKAFLDRYKVVGIDEKSSQTMLAHISKDGHYYIYPDLKQCRSISVREAARIQSFPDSFFFEGSRTSAFVQIGNAVPPLLSYKIAQQIKNYLSENK